jgi:glutamate 5-kinase
MHIYSKFFGEYGNVVGQVLLTRDVVEDDHIRNNVINTFETLLEKGVIPIVNENDTVSIDEIENICNFGDNDNLSAIVAKLIKGDLLIILSDIDGFYDSDPRHNEDSKMIKEIYEVNKELEEFAGGAGSSQGTGGMKTKLAAAKVALGAGVNMILTNGKDPEILFDILEGQDVGTLFINKRGLINE